MQLDIPFYTNTNDGNQCMQVTMQCVLDYFLKKKFDVSELDRITGRKPHYWTYTAQIIGALWDLGLNAKYFSSDPLEPYTQTAAVAEAYIRKSFPKDAETILKHSDLPIVVKYAKQLQKKNLYEQRTLTFPEVEEHVKAGHVPLMLIDYAVLEKQKTPYKGHFVVLTGFDEKTVTYHESGPEKPLAHRRVPKQNFIDAWFAPAAGNDIIIVYGKREK
jgi:hypothetical protein